MTRRSTFIHSLGIALAMATLACSKSPATTDGTRPDTASITVSDDGSTVTLPPADAARIPVSEAGEAPLAVQLTVPARTVATARKSSDLPAPLLLFETPELSSLYGEYTRARVTFDRAAKQRTRLRELFQHDAAAGKDVDDAEADFATAEATLRDTEAKLREGGLDPSFLSTLRPGTAFVVADVVEGSAKLVHTGMSATVTFTSAPDSPRQGRVTTVAEAVDPQTRTIRVGLSVLDASGALRPGMFASVRLDRATVHAVSIPSTATIAADARQWVFVRVAPTKFVRRAVTLGADDGQRVEVRAGVAPGEQVVTGNAILLKGLAFGY